MKTLRPVKKHKTLRSTLKQDYDVVLADPPWKHYGAGDKWAAAQKEYDCLDFDEIVQLDFSSVMHNRSLLFLWTTSSQLKIACDLLDAWDLHYRGVAFVWVKTGKNGVPFGARGVRPSVVKPITEFVILGSHMAKGRPLPLASEAIVQTVFAPIREHSRKPDEVRERIGLLFQEPFSRVELFARERFDGWDAWGNEVDSWR